MGTRTEAQRLSPTVIDGLSVWGIVGGKFLWGIAGDYEKQTEPDRDRGVFF